MVEQCLTDTEGFGAASVGNLRALYREARQIRLQASAQPFKLLLLTRLQIVARKNRALLECQFRQAAGALDQFREGLAAPQGILAGEAQLALKFDDQRLRPLRAFVFTTRMS